MGKKENGVVPVIITSKEDFEKMKPMIQDRKIKFLIDRDRPGHTYKITECSSDNIDDLKKDVEQEMAPPDVPEQFHPLSFAEGCAAAFVVTSIGAYLFFSQDEQEDNTQRGYEVRSRKLQRQEQPYGSKQERGFRQDIRREKAINSEMMQRPQSRS